MSLPDKYKYEIRINYSYGKWKYNYTIYYEFGAIQLWIHGDMAGVEHHYNYRPEYFPEGSAPSHRCCDLLKQPCWHDGSSLHAIENILPVFDGTNHETMFNYLLERLET